MTKKFGLFIVVLFWTTVVHADIISVDNIHTARDLAASSCARNTETIDGAVQATFECENGEGFALPLQQTPNAGTGDTAWTLKLRALNPVNGAGDGTSCWSIRLDCADDSTELADKTDGTATQLTLENIAQATTFGITGTTGTGFNSAAGTRDVGNACTLRTWRNDAVGGGCDGDLADATPVKVYQELITN